MKNIDYLEKNLRVLEICNISGILPSDYRYIKMVREYNSLAKEGNKTTWIVAEMAYKYHLAESTVYNVVRRLNASTIFILE